MSAKILPFRVPRRAAPNPSPKMLTCPFCTFFTEDKLALEWHMTAVHERAMLSYGYRQRPRKQSGTLVICSVRNRPE